MNTFHFQQRQGWVDLDAMRNVDLERIIRDTDVDMLQLQLANLTFSELREEDVRRLSDPDVVKFFRVMQLTIEYLLHTQDHLAGNLRVLSSKYSSKKRDLLEKKKQIIELAESETMLRKELGKKRASLANLETLLKKTTRRGVQNEEPNINKSATNTPVDISFYVTCPDGLSFECRNEMKTMMVYELKSKIRRELHKSRGDSIEEAIEIRLVSRGQLMLDGMSIGETNLRDGDSIVALPTYVEKFVNKEDAKTKVKEETPSPQDQTHGQNVSSNNSEIVEILSRQQDLMTSLSDELKRRHDAELEIRSYSKQHQESNINSEMLLKLDERWSNMEVAMRQQLDSQLSHYQALLKESNERKMRETALRAGDMLSDDDEVLEREKLQEAQYMKELQAKLEVSSSRITYLENSMKSASNRDRILTERIEGQEGENKMLREQLSQLRQQLKSVTPSLIASSLSQDVKIVAERDTNTEVMVAPALKDDDKMNLTTETPPVTITVTEAVAAVTPSIELATSEPISTKVDINFPLPFNTDVAGYVDKFFSVNVYVSASKDNLVYEIRQQVSTLTGLSITRIVLSIKGQEVLRGNDINFDMTATMAVEMAADGDLIILVKESAVMSDKEVTELVSRWEQKQDSTSIDKIEGDSLVKDETANVEVKSTTPTSTARTRDSASNPHVLRQSYEDALEAVNGKQGLTDEEMDACMLSLPEDEQGEEKSKPQPNVQTISETNPIPTPKPEREPEPEPEPEEEKPETPITGRKEGQAGRYQDVLNASIDSEPALVQSFEALEDSKDDTIDVTAIGYVDAETETVVHKSVKEDSTAPGYMTLDATPSMTVNTDTNTQDSTLPVADITEESMNVSDLMTASEERGDTKSEDSSPHVETTIAITPKNKQRSTNVPSTNESKMSADTPFRELERRPSDSLDGSGSLGLSDSYQSED
jgi:hypothetical protein